MRTTTTDDYVYTDVPYTAARMRRAGGVLVVAISFVFINAVFWLVWGLLTSSKYLAIVEATFASAALIILLLRDRVGYRVTAHTTFWLALITITVGIICFEGTRSSDAPVDHLFFVVVAVATWLVLRDEDRIYGDIYVGVCVLAFLGVEFSIVSIAPLIPQNPEDHQIAQSISKLLIIGTLLAITRVYVRDIFDAERHLSAANARLEELLSNMLPISISERLRTEGKTFADGYANASVLFADMAGFTAMSAEMQPMAIVELLDELFSAFDELTVELGLEKIKTIGDAYMVAAGLPEPREDHAAALVEFALRMRAEVSKFSGIHIRVGINSGDVVAGVIGRKRFIYDLWGDTVNIASRMESHGVIDEIQISESTYAEVKDLYDCESRGNIELKGRGEMRVYLVRGRKVAGRNNEPPRP